MRDELTVPELEEYPFRRTLHLLDMDSLAPRPRSHRGTRRWGTWNSSGVYAYARAAGVTDGDDAAILGLEAHIDGEHIVVHSPHLADEAPTVALTPAECASRYWRVILGSGKHCYLPLVHALSAAGVWVVVACRVGLASVDLMTAAHEVVIVPASSLRGVRS